VTAEVLTSAGLVPWAPKILTASGLVPWVPGVDTVTGLVPLTGTGSTGGGGGGGGGSGGGVTSGFGLTQAVNFMTAANTVHPYSPGAVNDYSWFNGPQYGGLPPAQYLAGTPWTWVWWDAAYGAPSIPANVSIQMRQMIMAICSAGIWSYPVATNTFQAELDSSSTGGGTSDTPTLTTVTDGSGGVSFVPAPSEILQAYPGNGRCSFASGSVQGAYTEIQLRVIMTNPAGADNRAAAHFVANAGGDWWPTTSDTNGNDIANMANGGFAPVPNDGTWGTFCSWSGPSGFTPTWSGAEGAFPAGLSVAQFQANPPTFNYMGA
jgi:hypothetical protein